MEKSIKLQMTELAALAPDVSPEQIKQLVQWLRNASVTDFDFTIDGRQQVCKPKYLLTRDRDYIVGLLDRELAAELSGIDALRCGVIDRSRPPAKRDGFR